MISTVNDLYFLQDDEIDNLPRSTFDLSLLEFNENHKNLLFSDQLISQILTSISDNLPIEPTKTKEGKDEELILSSIESRVGSASNLNISSPIIILCNTQPVSYTHLLIDLIFKSEKEEQKQQKYEIIGEHFCVKENHLTRICQVVLCNLLDSICRKNKSIQDYLDCVEYDIFEKLFPQINIREPIPKIMLEFFEILKHAPINHNFVYIIQNVEYMDDEFFKAMRRLRNKFPNFLKILMMVKDHNKSVRVLSMLSGSKVIKIQNGNFMNTFCTYFCNKNIENCDKEFISTCINLIENKQEKVKKMVKEIENIKKEQKKEKIKKEEVLEILMHINDYGRFKRITKAVEIIKKIESHQEKELLEKIIMILIEVRSPIHIFLLESWLGEPKPALSFIKEFEKIFAVTYINENGKQNIGAESVIRISHRNVWKELYGAKLKENLKTIIKNITEQCLQILISDQVGDMHEYYWLNSVYHYLKLPPNTKENHYISPKWLFAQIDGFKSFDYTLLDLARILKVYNENGINILKNTVIILENIYCGKRLIASEFIAQLKSRFFKETDPVLQEICSHISAVKFPYFNASHPALKENNNVVHILESDSPITAVFMTPEYLVYATEQGLLFIHSIKTFLLVYQYLLDSGILSLCYAKDGKFLVGTRISSIYLWSIKGTPEKNPEAKIEGHMDGTKKIVCVDGNVFFSIGFDNSLVKGFVEPLNLDKRISLGKQRVRQIEATKFKKEDKTESIIVILGFDNGHVKIFDDNLNLLSTLTNFENPIVSLQALKAKEHFMSVSTDGEINIYNDNARELLTSLSIFHINQEELREVFLYEKTNLLVSIEKNNIRIYKPGSCSLLDDWIYLFKTDIKIAVKSSDDSYLIICDNDCRLCIFDMLKPVEQRFALGIPSHRHEYGISFILSTISTQEMHAHLITCSGEREVKVWTRDSCKFVKKFNLSAVASIFIIINPKNS